MDPRGSSRGIDPLAAAVERLRRGDGEAAADIDRLLRPRLTRYFQSGPWPRDEAEDLVQQTLVLVFKSVRDLKNPDRFLPWLFAIARNVRSTTADRWTTRRRFESEGLDSVADPPAPSDIDARERDEVLAQRTKAVRRALMSLPSRQRQCLLLQVRERMSYEEIAATLRLSSHTVRNHIAQAKESLRRLMVQGHEARIP